MKLVSMSGTSWKHRGVLTQVQELRSANCSSTRSLAFDFIFSKYSPVKHSFWMYFFYMSLFIFVTVTVKFYNYKQNKIASGKSLNLWKNMCCQLLDQIGLILIVFCLCRRQCFMLLWIYSFRLIYCAIPDFVTALTICYQLQF